jgi:hypothetical protein
MKIFNIILIVIIIIFVNLKYTYSGVTTTQLSLFSSQHLIKGIASNKIYSNSYQKNDLKLSVNQSIDYKPNKKQKTSNKLIFLKNCPYPCSCQGLSVDCSYRSLTLVPKNIPKHIIKLYFFN